MRAGILAVLLWPACAAGAFLGMVVGVILGAVGDNSGWAALGWGFVGCILGVAVGGLLLGWIWAIACHRRRALPIIAVTLLPTIGTLVGLPLILAVPGSSNDGLRIILTLGIVVAVTALVYLVGRVARERGTSQGVSARS